MAMYQDGFLEERPRGVPVGGFLRDRELSGSVIVESIQSQAFSVVDLTIIATETSRHVKDALRFASSTKTLLIEKPLAVDIREASMLLQARDLCPTAVSTPLRFHAGFRELQAELLTVGSVQSVKIVCQSWLPDWRPGRDFRQLYSSDPQQGGVLRDLVHEIDVAVTLFGTPLSVAATLSSSPLLNIPVETYAHMVWRYPSFNLEMVLDCASLIRRREVKVRGPKTSLQWDVIGVSLHVQSSSGDRSRTFPDDLQRDEVLKAQMLAASSLARDDHRGGVSRPSQGIVDAMRTLRIVEMAKASHAAAGQPVIYKFA